MLDYVSFFIGVVCAAAGGELFVRGAVGLASWARIAPGIIGATVAAFATSSPELSVAVSASVAGTPQVALGDALGSNVVNVALILGLVLVISPLQSSRSGVRRDFPVALLVPILTGILAVDGQLSRSDGALMLVLFATWLTLTAIEARRQRSAAPQVLGAHRLGRVVASTTAGLALLVAAGILIVTGATGIARAFHIDEFIVGATIVAIGTSAPELATAIIAKLRGHDEIGLGTLLGSNIFNGLFIVSIATLIHPIAVNWREVGAALLFGLAALLLAYPTRSGAVPRSRGVALLVLYGIYIAAILRP